MASDSDSSVKTDGSTKDRSEQLRETTKWLMTIFGAVGAVLIGGLQLSGLGNVAGSWLWAAILGFAVAIAGVAWIIWQLTQVFSAGIISRIKLEGYYGGKAIGGVVVDDKTFFLGRFNSLKEFIDGLDDHQVKWWGKTAAERQLPEHQLEARYFSAAQANIQRAASQGLVVQAFRDSINRAFWGFIVAAIGLAVFAYSTSQPQPIAVQKAQALSPQVLTINTEKISQYSGGLGVECAKEPLNVIVLGQSAEKLDVLSLSSEKCRYVRLVLPAADVSLTKVEQ